MMQLITSDLNKIKSVAILGRLDTTTYPSLEECLNQLFTTGTRQLVIDCSQMDYVSSSGLRVFLMMLKKMKSENGTLVICGLQAPIYNVFEISGFLSIFNIAPDVEKALGFFDQTKD